MCVLHCYTVNCLMQMGQTALHMSVVNQSVAVTTRLCACKTCDPYVFDNVSILRAHKNFLIES